MYRIVWKIGDATGHGEWTDGYDRLTAWVAFCNATYGKGTHWLESR